MRPMHPNDMANQVALMKSIRDAIANSTPVARPVQGTSDTELNVSVTSASGRRPWESEGDFSFAR